MTTKFEIESVLKDYMHALRQPDGTEAVMSAESILFKKGLDAQLAGKKVLLMHYQDNLAHVKRRGAVNSNIEAYGEDYHWAAEDVTEVTKQIEKLESE